MSVLIPTRLGIGADATPHEKAIRPEGLCVRVRLLLLAEFFDALANGIQLLF
jgi:hypothetical protein